MNIDRINELARKAKAEGLTPAEKEEQAALRAEYIANIRANLGAQLDNIDIRQADGTIVNLGERHRQRMENEVMEYERREYEKSVFETLRKKKS